MEGVIKEGTIGAVLFKSNIINEQDIVAALKEQQNSGCRFGEALVKLGIVTQEDIDWGIANQLNIPYVRLKKEQIDRDAVALVPKEIARRYNLLPILRAGDELHLVMADPLNKGAVEEVERLTGLQVTVSIALMRELRDMLDYFHGPELDRQSLGFVSDVFPSEVSARIDADLTGSRLIDYLLLFIRQNGLSSISLQPLADRVRIMTRRAGVSHPIGQISITYYPDLLMKLRRLSKMGGSAESAGKGTLAFRYKGENLLFQLLLLRGMGGELATIKPQPSVSFPSTIDELVPDSHLRHQLTDIISARSGILLVLVDDEHERARLLDLIVQTLPGEGRNTLLLGEHLGYGKKQFSRIPCHDTSLEQSASIISAALEHEPDILIIEELGNSRAFSAAGRGALHGTLIVAGVPYHDIPTTLKHLLNFSHHHYFPRNELLGIIRVSGVMTLCQHCRQPYTPTESEKKSLKIATSLPVFSHSAGCDECSHSGYAGKRYLVEFLHMDRALHEQFDQQKDAAAIMAGLREKGHQGIADQALKLLEEGAISASEYLLVLS